MALQVWLPLTKDLRNQGLSDVTVTNNGATFNSAGKLGGCYSFNGSSNYLTIPQGYFGANYSYSLWFYTTSTSITQNLGCCRSNVGEGFAIFLIGGKIRIDGGGAGDATQWTTNYTFPVNTWTHFTVTCTNGVLKFYINGTYQGTKTITLNSSKWGTIYSVGASQANGSSYGNYLNGKINDVRIYNHCLSPMEVKQLSQGLVLHYPLNRQGWGQENLLLNSNDLTLWPIESSGQIELQEDGYFKVSSKASNTTRYGIYYDFTFPEPDTYTFSVDVRDDWLIGVAPASTFTWTTANLSGTQGKKRISYTCTSTEENNKCRIYIAGTGTGGRVTYLKQPKLEKGSIATPWCPNSSDELATKIGLNSTTEYDCSGFCNNGTRTGTFSWTSNTPKYAVSQYFNGSSYILTDSGTFSWFNFDKCTVAVWMKPTTTPSSWAGTFGIAHNNSSSNKSFVIGNYGGKFTMQSANGSWVNIQSSNLPINEWHHCVATLDGTIIKMYFDGELVNTYTINWGNTTVASDTRVQVGNDLPGSDEIYQGYYSDARIYATALSASDVKSLYQNSAYVDSSGNVYGAVHTEV